jgi:type I restriction enzyme R subunit
MPFEHFSDVVVSDFDPFGDKKVLDVLLTELKKSDTYDKFFAVFMGIYKDPAKRDEPESYLDFESSLKNTSTPIRSAPQIPKPRRLSISPFSTALNT